MYIAVDKETNEIVGYSDVGEIEEGYNVLDVPYNFYRDYKPKYFKYDQNKRRIIVNEEYTEPTPVFDEKSELDMLLEENKLLKEEISELKENFLNDKLEMQMAIAELAEAL